MSMYLIFMSIGDYSNENYHYNMIKIDTNI